MKNTKKKESKAEKIKNHLLKGYSISPAYAWKNFGHQRLAVVIERLRKKGIAINTELVEYDGSKFARYSLIIE